MSPWIRRHCRTAIHRPRAAGAVDYSHLRCTIDDGEDYQRICRLFEGVEDPVHAGWFDLVKTLASSPGEPAFRVRYRIASGRVYSELTLGTAQLGMQYGVTNRTGQPSRELGVEMVAVPSLTESLLWTRLAAMAKRKRCWGLHSQARGVLGWRS